MTVILILAAGKSSRMRGADKLLEPVDGLPLLRRQCLRAIATGIPVYVALPDADHPRNSALQDIDVNIIFVPESVEGMSGSMRGAEKRLPPDEAILLILPDLIQLDTGDMSAVATAMVQSPADMLIWRGATEDGKPGHPVMFHPSLRAEFALLEGDSGGEPIVKKHKNRTELVPLSGQKARLDLDTPEEWAAFRSGELA